MSQFLGEDYFLTTEKSKALYHKHIASLPIIDYHTHLQEKEILENRRFQNLWELWLEYDHYKWRLMRGCGIAEKYITGDALPYEKFEKFASCLPFAVGNPVSHWAHLELKRLFDINLVINEQNAKEIWNKTEQILQNALGFNVLGILDKFQVQLVCTTDDPTADLLTHKAIKDNDDITLKVLPTFRPDNALKIDEPNELKVWLRQLADCVGKPIEKFADLLDALSQRHNYFHQNDCRLSDHGLSYCPQITSDKRKASEVFSKALSGKVVNEQEQDIYRGYVMGHIAKLNAQKGWTMQLHLGPIRNNSTRYFAQVGRDSGFDSMGDWSQTNRLIDFLDKLEIEKALPKTIVYNLNPTESESICCALQSFQTNSSCAGSIQYGVAWWHLDHKRGILEQLEILSSLGVLGTSLGMLTDSRSFSSYVRHEYYRRILCDFIGKGIEAGEIPDDEQTIQIVRNIAYYNVNNRFVF